MRRRSPASKPALRSSLHCRSIDFEDTYDGLGDQLDEADDDLNDATFGGGATSTTSAKLPGKDFDFLGQTAKLSNAINEEQSRYNWQQAPVRPQSPPKPKKSFKTGYEAYQDPDYIPDLQSNPGIWETSRAMSGNLQRPQSGTQPTAVPTKKMMSLEEVEAAMQAQARKIIPVPQAQAPVPPSTALPPRQPQTREMGHSQSSAQTNIPLPQPQLQQTPQHHPARLQRSQAELPSQPISHTQPTQAPQILQRGQPTAQHDVGHPAPPRQILQNPQRLLAQLTPRVPEPRALVQQPQQIAPSGPMTASHQLPVVLDAQQLMRLSEPERAAYLLEDAKRAKRNHKIWLLSRDNGFMTPQDKNFITRIQLQQLMTATGIVTEQDPDAALSEDFYYQVTSQIRGGTRQNSQQPLSNFAQTYLFQTGSRQGGRRQNRVGDNHMQRMEMQVQRAVEAAKAKPKNKQLVIEGSLGKISFSNAKTPKPLLNLKRQDSSAGTRKALPTELSASDRKSVLRNIEAVYTTLMKMEDHERRLPPPPSNESDTALIETHLAWRQAMQELSKKLWMDLKVMEPIMSESSVLHPFIAFLSYPKGKKAIPRIFRHLDPEKRLTILTMIVVLLNVLDVIRLVQPEVVETRSSIAAREEVELFCQTVMPSLFAYVNEAPLQIVIGLLGLILDRTNMQALARTKVGLSILTMLTSRAELVKQAENRNDQEWDQWLSVYNRFFDAIEPVLPNIFPGSVSGGQDIYVWQFLAASGVGASPEQQQRLVLAVKYVIILESKYAAILTSFRDRVMQTVAQSKTLPPDMASQRLSNVNLFMRAIGLDVDLLG